MSVQAPRFSRIWQSGPVVHPWDTGMPDQFKALADYASAVLAHADYNSAPYTFPTAPGEGGASVLAVLNQIRADAWYALVPRTPGGHPGNQKACCCSGPWPIPVSEYTGSIGDTVYPPDGMGSGRTLAMYMGYPDYGHSPAQPGRRFGQLKAFTCAAFATLRFWTDIGKGSGGYWYYTDGGHPTTWAWGLTCTRGSKLRLTLGIVCSSDYTTTFSPAPTSTSYDGTVLTVVWTDVACTNVSLNITASTISYDYDGTVYQFDGVFWSEYTGTTAGDGVAADAVQVIYEDPQWVVTGAYSEIATVFAFVYNDGYNGDTNPYPRTVLYAKTLPIRWVDYVFYRSALNPQAGLRLIPPQSADGAGNAVYECSHASVLCQPKGTAGLVPQTTDITKPMQPGPWLSVIGNINDFLWIDAYTVTRKRKAPDQHRHFMERDATVKTYPEVPYEVGYWRGSGWHALETGTIASNRYWSDVDLTTSPRGWPLFDNIRLAVDGDCWLMATAIQQLNISAFPITGDLSGIDAGRRFSSSGSQHTGRDYHFYNGPVVQIPAAVYNDTWALIDAVAALPWIASSMIDADTTPIDQDPRPITP